MQSGNASNCPQRQLQVLKDEQEELMQRIQQQLLRLSTKVVQDASEASECQGF